MNEWRLNYGYRRGHRVHERRRDRLPKYDCRLIQASFRTAVENAVAKCQAASGLGQSGSRGATPSCYSDLTPSPL